MSYREATPSSREITSSEAASSYESAGERVEEEEEEDKKTNVQLDEKITDNATETNGHGENIGENGDFDQKEIQGNDNDGDDDANRDNNHDEEIDENEKVDENKKSPTSPLDPISNENINSIGVECKDKEANVESSDSNKQQDKDVKEVSVNGIKADTEV